MSDLSVAPRSYRSEMHFIVADEVWLAGCKRAVAKVSEQTTNITWHDRHDWQFAPELDLPLPSLWIVEASAQHARGIAGWLENLRRQYPLMRVVVLLSRYDDSTQQRYLEEWLTEAGASAVVRMVAELASTLETHLNSSSALALNKRHW